MTVEFKYNIGDKVYFPFNNVSSVRMRKPCPACEGKQVITVNGYEYRCTNCFDGYQYKYGMYLAKPYKCTVLGIEYNTNKDETATRYYIRIPGCGNMSVLEENIFQTAEDCQVKCDELSQEYNKAKEEGWEPAYK